jgi:hypothetical protein
MRQVWCGIIILAMCTSCVSGPSNPSGAWVAVDHATASAITDATPVAPGKFIPTFTILYAGAKSDQVLKEAAQFDLIDAGVHAASDVGTWPALKQLNPHLKIFVYEMGPGEYNTWVDFTPGQGWDWMTARHGLTSADRWTAIGARGDYIQDGKERLMVIGNPAWQQYWLDGVINQFWAPTSPNCGADGVYSDNTDYEWPSEDVWYRQGHPEQPDVPADYYHNGVYDPEPWKAQAKAFLDRAVTELGDQHRLFIPNFGYMSKDPESWHDLDSQPHPVFGAMEEGAFVTPWGAKGQFKFYTEPQWLNQVNAMRHLKHTRALMSVHGLPDSKAAGVARMDVADASGTCGWDVLWFGLTSFLQGYDDVRQNAYFGFTIWSYNTKAFWLDEFDPAHLNLGHALGESHQVDAALGHCYVREFDSGWVVVNPTDALAQGVPVPQGQARVLDHGTFEHPQAQPLVTRFDLPSHRGVILLKAGRQAGDPK